MKKKDNKDQLIANLLLQGRPYADIINTLKTSNSRISRISSQLKNNSPPIRSATMGRPHKVTDELIRTIESQTLENPQISGNALSSIIASNLGIQVSRTTINSIRNELHFRFTHPRRRQFMTEKKKMKIME